MSAEEGQEVGLVLEVVEHEELLARAQDLAEDWVGAGRTRALPAGADRSAINTFPLPNIFVQRRIPTRERSGVRWRGGRFPVPRLP